ncbi:hypothetical protein [Dongia sp.]|jgi:hypothetical protein
MQTIAIACVGAAAVNASALMGTLWYIASTGRRPGWVAKLLG